MSGHVGKSFQLPTTGGEFVTAVILADIKWDMDRYAVVAYEQQTYPNVFLWHWNSVEQLIGCEVEEDND
jgi:hypothetical protein